jgi:hypothetical protein
MLNFSPKFDNISLILQLVFLYNILRYGDAVLFVFILIRVKYFPKTRINIMRVASVAAA